MQCYTHLINTGVGNLEPQGYTLSGRTGNASVWHSEGRTIDALSVQ